MALNSKSGEPPPPPRPVMLTKRGADILVQLEKMMDDANRALGPLPPTVSTGNQKQASRKQDALAVDLEGRAFERN